VIREQARRIDNHALGDCLIRNGQPMREFVARPYEPISTLSFLVSPATLDGETVFLICYPGWAGFVPIHPSATLLDFLAQHEESLAPIVKTLARLDLEEIEAGPRPVDRCYRLLTALGPAEQKGLDELVRLYGHQSFWSGRSFEHAADASELIAQAHAHVVDPMLLLGQASALVRASRTWARAW
jgi:hypothetical protein